MKYYIQVTLDVFRASSKMVLRVTHLLAVQAYCLAGAPTQNRFASFC
jgi:hypothetical protein